MNICHVMLGFCLSALSFPAFAETWVEVVSDNFVLYTDTDTLKGRLLLNDLEGRYAVFSSTFSPLKSRQFPIRVFLFKKTEELRDSVPESYLKMKGEAFGNPRMVAERSGYLVYSPTGTVILARDDSPSDIANDVSHPLGHLLIQRSTLWQPFWLEEAIGEYLRMLGRGGGVDAISEEDAYSIEDLLRIVQGKNHEDREAGKFFTRQSYQLLRVLLDKYEGQFRSYLMALKTEEGYRVELEFDKASVEEELSAYTDVELPLSMPHISATNRTMSITESAFKRAEMLVATGRYRAAMDLYNENPNNSSRIGLAILTKVQRESTTAWRSLEALSREFSGVGLLHYHFGTMAAETNEQRKAQIVSLKRAVELMPLMGRALGELAALYVADGRPEDSLPLLERAIEMEFESADRFYEILAEANMVLGDYKRAAESAEIAVRLPHHDPTSREHFSLFARTFSRKMNVHRRAAEAGKVAELRREVEELADNIDPRPALPNEVPAPIGRISLSVTSEGSREVTVPKLVSSILPDYPVSLRRRGAEGKIVLGLELDRRGRISSLDVVRSDILELNASTIAAVQGWVFQPARRGNESIDFSFRLTLRFYLE